MSKKHLRKKFYVDKKVQGALVRRAASYWVTSIGVVGMLTALAWLFVGPGTGAFVVSSEMLRLGFWALSIGVLVAALLTPIVVFDFVRLSHRFTGPMVRLRDSMERSAAGESIDPIRFRDGDFWQEIATGFNGMQSRIDALEAALADERQRSGTLPTVIEPVAESQGFDQEDLVCG